MAVSFFLGVFGLIFGIPNICRRILRKWPEKLFENLDYFPEKERRIETIGTFKNGQDSAVLFDFPSVAAHLAAVAFHLS
jgi:hypothetical protein